MFKARSIALNFFRYFFMDSQEIEKERKKERKRKREKERNRVG